MASRRAVGEGSVYRRRDKEGKEIKDAWVAQITVGRKRKTFTGKTRKEATAKLDEYKKSAEFLLPTAGAEMTLEDFMTEWMSSVKRRTLKDTSYDRLECTVLNNIVPCIGSYKLNELTYGIIQNEVINRLQDDGKSYSTIKKAYNAPNESLKYAIFPKEIIVKNPMLGVVMPSQEQFDTKEIRYLSEEEIARFKNAATATWGNGKPIYPLGHARILTLNTGVRVRRFERKQSLVAFAGVDAPPYQSGAFESKKRSISKRGSPRLRKTLFQVMSTYLQHIPPNEPVFQFLDKKRREGKHYYVYMTAGANKFLRIYYGTVTAYLNQLDFLS